MIRKLLSKNLFKGLYKTSLCQNTLENWQANLALFSTFKINLKNSSNLTNVGNIQMLFSTNSNSNSTTNTGNQGNPQGIIGKNAGNNNNGASGDSTGNSNNGTSGSGAPGIEAPGSSNNGTSSGNSNNATSSGSSNNATSSGSSNNATSSGSSNNGRQSGNSNKGSQNNNSNQKMFSLKNMVFTVCASVIGSWIITKMQFQYNVLQQIQFLQNHQPKIVSSDFITQSPMYQQIQQKIISKAIKRFKLLSGCPGTGKSSAALKLAAQINKNDGQQAFYITMSDNNDKLEKQQNSNKSAVQSTKIKQLQKLIYLIKKKHYNNTNKKGYKSVKFIVDDFNRLWAAYMQNPTDGGLRQLIFDLYTIGKSQVIDPIYITSSSQCVYEQSDRSKNIYASEFQKYGSVFILDENVAKSKLKQLNWKILNKQLNKQIYSVQVSKEKSYSLQQLKQLKQKQEVLNRILLYTPRRLNILILELNGSLPLNQNPSKQKLQQLSKNFVQFVKKFQDKQTQKIQDKIDEALTKVQNKAKFIKALLKIQKCDQGNRFNLSKQLGFNARQIFDKLEKSNVTIFGRPRSILQRKVLQDLLKEYSPAQKKDGTTKTS